VASAWWLVVTRTSVITSHEPLATGHYMRQNLPTPMKYKPLIFMSPVSLSIR